MKRNKNVHMLITILLSLNMEQRSYSLYNPHLHSTNPCHCRSRPCSRRAPSELPLIQAGAALGITQTGQRSRRVCIRFSPRWHSKTYYLFISRSRTGGVAGSIRQHFSPTTFLIYYPSSSVSQPYPRQTMQF